MAEGRESAAKRAAGRRMGEFKPIANIPSCQFMGV